MRSCRSEIERLVPALRQIARALVDNHRADLADDLVHEAIADVIRGERTWAVPDVETRLLTRLIAANRTRLRADAEERHSLPEMSARGESGAARAQPGVSAPRGSTGIDVLNLGDREALLLVVLGQVDHARAADILGIPLGTLVTRLTHARETLGAGLWASPSSKPRPAPGHLRLVKS